MNKISPRFSPKISSKIMFIFYTSLAAISKNLRDFFAIRLLIPFLIDVDIQLILEFKNSFEK